MKGPCDVWFTIAMAGCSFQLPVKNEGRLIPVCQLIAVLNVWSKSTRRRPPGTVESGMSTSCRALLMLSARSKVLLQFQGPMRSGDGARFTVGMVWDTRPFPTSWLRLPPTLNVPQSNCLVKFTCDVRLAVARNGFTVLV